MARTRVPRILRAMGLRGFIANMLRDRGPRLWRNSYDNACKRSKEFGRLAGVSLAPKESDGRQIHWELDSLRGHWS
jgi:hypothetical protein